MKHKRFRTTALRQRWRGVLALAALLVLAVSLAVGAAGSGAISQSYQTSGQDISQGALVSLTAHDASSVELAGSASGAKLVGMAANKPLVELSGGQKHSVAVVTNGTTKALVSNINGSVKLGDKITASPISGVGMKALKAGEIVGTAQANLQDLTTVSQTVATTCDTTITFAQPYTSRPQSHHRRGQKRRSQRSSQPLRLKRIHHRLHYQLRELRRRSSDHHLHLHLLRHPVILGILRITARSRITSTRLPDLALQIFQRNPRLF